MAKAVYIRTDKNGTQIFHDYTCPRCGGAGGSEAWAYTGYTCYECGGSGRRSTPEVIKKYTPEYRAKLDERAKKRMEKKRLEQVAYFNEHKQEMIEAKGFNAEGKLYVAVGETYSIKEELSEGGAKWKPLLGWCFTLDPEQYQTVEVTAEECLIFYEYGAWVDWNREVDFKKLIHSKLSKEDQPESNYIGEVGDKLNLIVTLEKIVSYERTSYTGWGTEMARIYKFRDESGNILIWNTGSWQEIGEGTKVHLTGKIKEHNEYKGEMQTVLTRCRINFLEPVA